MRTAETMPGESKVLMNHIYKYKKGVRQMVLYTFNKKHEGFAVNRLENQNIDYFIQPAGNRTLNLFFGRATCIDAVRRVIDKLLDKLTPEEDFILGAMLSYDIRLQRERYCRRGYKKCNGVCAGYDTVIKHETS